MRAEQLVFIALVLAMAGIVLLDMTTPKPAPQAPTNEPAAEPIPKAPGPSNNDTGVAPQNNGSSDISSTYAINGPPSSCFLNADTC